MAERGIFLLCLSAFVWLGLITLKDMDGNGTDQNTHKMELLAKPRLAVLDCSTITQGPRRAVPGGVTELRSIRNIAYWQINPIDDANYLYNSLPPVGEGAKYVTFLPGRAGWNNVRMGFETILLFALMTRRSLVLPSTVTLAHQEGENKGRGGPVSTPFESLLTVANMGRHIELLSEQQFVASLWGDERVRAALGAHLLSPAQVWTKRGQRQLPDLYRKLAQSVGGADGNGIPNFSPFKFAFVFPSPEGGSQREEEEGVEEGKKGREEGVEEEERSSERIHLFLAGRKAAVYTPLMQRSFSIHFENSNLGARLFTHPYTYITSESQAVTNYWHRRMRDLLHFRDEVFCKAAQVISLLEEDSGGGRDSFAAFHIRRGDFAQAFRGTVKPADAMLRVLESMPVGLGRNETVMILTNEGDSSFFDPFRSRFNIRFLSDYFEAAGVSELASPLWPLVESVIAANAKTFVGTPFSTFTSYINRLRGYYKKPRDSSWLFDAERSRKQQSDFWPRNPMWASEFPMAWEGIDVETPLPAAQDFAFVK